MGCNYLAHERGDALNDVPVTTGSTVRLLLTCFRLLRRLPMMTILGLPRPRYPQNWIYYGRPNPLATSDPGNADIVRPLDRLPAGPPAISRHCKL